MAIQNQQKRKALGNGDRGPVSWYVRPIGDESYHRIREYLEGAEHITLGCLRAGRVVKLQLFKITPEQRDDILASDKRFSREIYKQYGEFRPRHWSSIAKLRDQVGSVVRDAVRRRSQKFVTIGVH